jgi:hypothetical protein
MKPYLQMSESEKWDHGLRQRPLTMVMMIAATFIPAGSVIYVAVFIDDQKMRKVAWLSWAGVTFLLLVGLLAVWRLEETDAISEGPKRAARGLMYWIGLVFAVGALVVTIWPDIPFALRVKAAGLLCATLTGWIYLKPLLR